MSDFMYGDQLGAIGIPTETLTAIFEAASKEKAAYAAAPRYRAIPTPQVGLATYQPVYTPAQMAEKIRATAFKIEDTSRRLASEMRSAIPDIQARRMPSNAGRVEMYMKQLSALLTSI